MYIRSFFATVVAASAVDDEGSMLAMRALVKNDAIIDKPPDAKPDDMTFAEHSEELDFVENLALTAVGAKSTIDDAAKTALKAIRKTLDTSLLLINGSHHTDQGLVNAQLQQVESCGTTFGQKKQENSNSKGDADTLETAHTTCRSTLGGLIDDKTAKCTQLAGFVNGLTPPNSVCDVPAEGTLTTYWTHYKTFYDDNFGTWEQLQQECDNYVGLAQSTEVTCDTKQSAFESAMCQLEVAVISACDAYSSCYDSAAADFGSVKVTALAQAYTRKVEYKSAEKIKCYIKILLAEETVTIESVAKCKEFDADVSHLEMNIPSLPGKEDCDKTSITDLPCSAAFTAKYTGMAGVDACIPCAPLPPYLSDGQPADDDTSSTSSGGDSLSDGASDDDTSDFVILDYLVENHCEQKDGWTLMTEAECKTYMNENNWAPHHPTQSFSGDFLPDGKNCIRAGGKLAFNTNPEAQSSNEWMTVCARREKAQ